MNTLPEGTIRCRVIRQQREQYGIADEQGNEYAARVSGKYMNNAAAADDYPAVGDYVAARIEGDTAIIHALFPRKSAFVRKVSGKTFAAQVVAANVDTVFLCMSLNENFNARRMERYVAAAWESGARPVIVLTKADICSDVDAKLNELYSAAPGVDIVAVCAMDGMGMDKLSPYIAKGGNDSVRRLVGRWEVHAYKPPYRQRHNADRRDKRRRARAAYHYPPRAYTPCQRRNAYRYPRHARAWHDGCRGGDRGRI